jgi:hypothetical protein
MPDNRDNIDHNVGASDKRREIGLLVDQLGGRSRSDRAAAEFALKKLGATAIPALVNALQLEKRKKDIWFICALCSCYLCILPSHLMEVWHLPFVVRALYTAGMGLGPMSLARFAVQPNKKQKSIVRLLVNAEDINVIAPLVEALTYGGRHDVEVLRTVTAGLVRLLPQLRASDAHLLNDKQRTHLRRALSGTDKPLTIAILKALEQVGDARDLPFVEKIGSPDAEVMEAAKACLPFLLARAEQQKVSQILLRASDMNSTTSVVLLRPVTGHESLEPQTLLRAVSGGVEDVQ